MQDFHNLEVWKKAHNLALDLFRTTGTTSRHDPFLASQLRRLGTLIPARITEGAAKDGNDEFAVACNFLAVTATNSSISSCSHAISNTSIPLSTKSSSSN
jgi:23S rRNA-intervening sequence protein